MLPSLGQQKANPMFIKLTQLPNYIISPTASPVYVNPDFITHMLPYEKKIYRYDLRAAPSEPCPQETALVTCICFPAGLQEEVDSIDVQETLEEILYMIGQCNATN